MSVGVVAFAFGSPKEVLANKWIAEQAEAVAKSHSAPIFTQRDVPCFCAYRATEELGNPPPTLRIAREAIKWSQKLGIDTLMVSAATPHLWRCRRDLQRASDEVGASISIMSTPAYVIPSKYHTRCNKKWFSQESTQKRTRSPLSWWPREILLRLMPFWLYKRVAS